MKRFRERKLAMIGVAYGAYHHSGESPISNVQPSPSEVSADLDQLDEVADHVLIYSSNPNTGFAGYVRTAAGPRYHFDVIPTAFLNDVSQSWAAAVNQDEINGLISLLKEDTLDLRYAMVGS